MPVSQTEQPAEPGNRHRIARRLDEFVGAAVGGDRALVGRERPVVLTESTQLPGFVGWRVRRFQDEIVAWSEQPLTFVRGVGPATNQHAPA